jgi:hypothetical protein
MQNGNPLLGGRLQVPLDALRFLTTELASMAAHTPSAPAPVPQARLGAIPKSIAQSGLELPPKAYPGKVQSTRDLAHYVSEISQKGARN